MDSAAPNSVVPCRPHRHLILTDNKGTLELEDNLLKHMMLALSIHKHQLSFNGRDYRVKSVLVVCKNLEYNIMLYDSVFFSVSVGSI
jgi:hypothetical protein